MTTDKPDKQTNYDRVIHDSAGLSLRTRTISSVTVPSNCLNSDVNGPRPRGRPPKKLNRIAEKKLLKKTIRHSDKIKNSDLTATIAEIDLTSNVERLKEQVVNKFTVSESSNDKDTELLMDIVSTNVGISTESSNLSSYKRKNNARKRKQASDSGEIAEKCILISDNSKDSLISTNNRLTSSLSTDKQIVDDNVVKYGFLANHGYKQYTDLNVSSTSPSIFYGNTYLPINWEYSAASLTSHVQKKASKDTLRKIRLINDGGTQTAPLLLKTTPTKKCQSIASRRGSTNKLASASIEISSGIRHLTATMPINSKRIGRPPGKKNKLLQAVIKSNSPRKSPRQHASTLAAILSNRALKNEIGSQADKLIGMGGESKNSLDNDGPCVLTAMPRHDQKPEVRPDRRRRQLDHQYGTVKSRRRQRRSITPTPPKLCAQHTPINSVTVDHDIVKLRTKHVDIIKRRARDERVRTNFIYQQLCKIHEVAEQNRHDLSQTNAQISDGLENCQAIMLPPINYEDSIWTSVDNDKEPDNMCLQIMYEQTGDKRFLCTDLTDETLQMYHQQRDLVLAERLSNNNGDCLSSDLGTDIILNKRKKKRPNMTGWPKEKRRKTIITSNLSMTRTLDINCDSDVDLMAKRRKAAEQQKLRRRRIKLEQKLKKEKSKVNVTPKTTPKRPGRRPKKKNKATSYRHSTNLNSTPTSNNKEKEKKLKIQKRRKQRITIQNNSVTTIPLNIKKNCGRPKGSIGARQKLKLQLLQQNQASSEQQKENISQPTTSGKLKCVISTRNNHVKLLSSSSSSENLSKKRTLVKSKKATTTYNLSSSSLEPLPSVVTVKGKTGKRRKLQEPIATTITWDVGRPKRYHHSRSTTGGVEEEFCFVGSQPFEQHCPGVGGLSHKTVLESNQGQKENSIHV